MISRRQFLQTASTSVVAGSAIAAMPGWGHAMPYSAEVRRAANALDDGQLKALLHAAVDAARAAGATYADARITVIRVRMLDGSSTRNDDEWRAVGVRVLVNNAWGFMSSGRLTTDEVTRLGTQSVWQAKSHDIGDVLEVDLGERPTVSNGEWKTPIKYDPFDIPMGEQRDMCLELSSLMTDRQRRAFSGLQMYFRRERKLFFSSDGASFDQTTYATSGGLSGQYYGQYSKQLEMAVHGLPVFPMTGKGWEYFSETTYHEHLREHADWLAGLRHRKPVEVDRCDAVFSPQIFANILDGVVGAATELDRVMGYQANANGTSYLSDPLEMLGTYQIGSKELTIEADRSMPYGLATVKWDDEGMEPMTFPLIEQGVLTDFQTTREQAAWLAPYYARAHKPVRSRGCATAESALFVTTQHTPNLRVRPGASGVTTEMLIRDINRGVYVEAGIVHMDQQQLNGYLSFPTLRLIRNGKLGDYIQGAGIPFRGPDFLKRVVALGGPDTAVTSGYFRDRGEPKQRLMHSINTVSAKVANVDIIDAGRAGGMA